MELLILFIGLASFLLVILVPCWKITCENNTSEEILYKLAISICIIIIGCNVLLFISAYNSEPYKIDEGIIEYNPYCADISDDKTFIKYTDVFGHCININNIQKDTVNYIEAYIEYKKPTGILKHIFLGEGIIISKNTILHITDEEYQHLCTYK